MDLHNFFSSKNIAIIGVSREAKKVGHVIFRNFIDSNYQGNIFIINPNAEEILGRKAYKSILEIKDKIDLVVIAVPAAFVLKSVEECGKKKIKNVIIVTSGFSEVGNSSLEEKLAKLLKKYKIRCIGPNCLGVFDGHTRLDTLFLPRYRLTRPKQGGIGFIVQSGAVGSTILDISTQQGYGCSKFISYGNALNTDESDLLEYLGQDENTKVICMYIEGIKDGRKFLRIAKIVARKKPVIVIKGGLTEKGGKATMSHTGSLAGKAEIYLGAFKQSNIIHVNSLEEMFEAAKILEKTSKPKGNRVQIITNGGGYGILASDALVNNKLEFAELASKTKKELKKVLPPLAVVDNPMDLIGDATTERYKIAIEASLKDDNVDILLVIALYQTPLLSTDIVDIITEANDFHKKPIIVVSAGAEFTEVLSKSLEENGIPTFMFPENAVRAVRHLVEYYRNR